MPENPFRRGRHSPLPGGRDRPGDRAGDRGIRRHRAGVAAGQDGLHHFDGGFVNTSSTKSGITYIDGDAGILRYRGYPIEQLAEKSTFIEVSYLLIYGELPTAESCRSSPPGFSGTRPRAWIRTSSS